MSYVFTHYRGSRVAADKAITLMRSFDRFFRNHTASDYARAPLKDCMFRLKKTLETGLKESLENGRYSITIREVSDLSKVCLYNGQTSGISWSDSIHAGRLVFENVLHTNSSQLFAPAVKKISHPGGIKPGKMAVVGSLNPAAKTRLAHISSHPQPRNIDDR